MNKMDLLSVVMHEIGHQMGLTHDDHGLMNDTIAAGTRTASMLAGATLYTFDDDQGLEHDASAESDHDWVELAAASASVDNSGSVTTSAVDWSDSF